jgi:hypothetical protein
MMGKEGEVHISGCCMDVIKVPIGSKMRILDKMMGEEGLQ